MPRHIPRVWTHFLLPVTAAAAADPPTYQHLQQYHCYTMLPLWRDGGQLCTPCCMDGFHSGKSENNGTNLWGNSFRSTAHYLFINLDLLLPPPPIWSLHKAPKTWGLCQRKRQTHQLWVLTFQRLTSLLAEIGGGERHSLSKYDICVIQDQVSYSLRTK